MTLLGSLQSTFSDLHKDVHGIRPRWQTEAQWNSVSWLQERIAFLSEELVEVQVRESAMEQVAIAQFELLVAATIAVGGENRETSIRWLMDAEDVDGDTDYFCYRHGLPYGYI